MFITLQKNMMIQLQDFSFSKREFPIKNRLCLHNTWGIFRKLPKNCKERKHIRIMIIAIIDIFLSFVIFDQQLKITFTISSAPPPLKKFTLPFLLTPPLKI